MKRNYLLFASLVAVVLLTGCNSEARKRAKFEETIDMMIQDYHVPEFSVEEKAHFDNINALVKEYGDLREYKTYNHEEGDKSDADFKRQYAKDAREIAAVDVKDRYKPLYDKRIKDAVVLFCDNKNSDYKSLISELSENPSDIESPENLAAQTKGKIPEFIYLDMEQFTKAFRELITSKEEKSRELAQKFLGYKYLAFVHPEYCYPPNITGENTYEGGIICGRLQLFNISDKKCLLDKRVFAVSSDRVASIYKVADADVSSNLYSNLKKEAELQISKCGVPLVDLESQDETE